MGSVKDLTVIKTPTDTALGVGKFTFSDRYSVFDWGEMPDHIPGKGRSLAMMSAYNFVELRKQGINSHFISLYSDDPGDDSGFDPERTSDTMYVHLTRVLPIDNDYAEFSKAHEHFLIPLEIIFRNGAPKGSSLFKKFARARNNPEEHKKLLKSLHLEEEPAPGDFFPQPVYDFTTKLESTDRALTDKEARRISGLNDTQFSELLNLAQKANDFITRQAKHAGLQHYDGKIEAMKRGDQVLLVDVLGTFDENRFLYNGEQVSKEILRQAYKALQPDWVSAVDAAKKEAAELDDEDWKSYCEVKPEPLPKDLIMLVSQIYQSGANLYVGETCFPGVPALDELIPKLTAQKEKYAE